MNLLRTTLVLMIIVIGIKAKCSPAPKCKCDYDGDDVDVEEQTQSTEALAGAVGALSSVVVSGGGIGVWYLMKSRSPVNPEGDSLMAEEGPTERPTQPPTRRKAPSPPSGERARNQEETSFRSPEAPFKTPNIYAAGMNDNLTHRVAASPRNVMTMDDF